MSKPTENARVERKARLRWVPIAKMRVSPLCQRDLRQARVDAIDANMDLEQLGNPTVSDRDGCFYVIDGQHRVEAYKQWIGEDWVNQSMQCWVHTRTYYASRVQMARRVSAPSHLSGTPNGAVTADGGTGCPPARPAVAAKP